MAKQLNEKQLEILRKHQFKKGEVQQPQGRTSPNKINQHIREVLSHAVQDNLPAVNKAIGSLLKSENDLVKSRGVDLYLSLLEFSQPKLQAVALKTDGASNSIIVIGKPADLELPSYEPNDQQADDGYLQEASLVDPNINNPSDDSQEY
ncbi:MAG TPA: hypothetical protein VK658_08720 [Chryseolinea sp.]|nr:hypothetical protein [Chryseolinea sp.]